MDELVSAFRETETPRPLPGELRDRLEGLFTLASAGPVVARIEGLAAPRGLSPRLRRRLWRNFRPSPTRRLLSARSFRQAVLGTAAAVLITTAVLVAGVNRPPDVAGDPQANRSGLSDIRDDIPLRRAQGPTDAPQDSQGQAGSESLSGSASPGVRTVLGGSSATSQKRYNETCFPDEPCETGSEPRPQGLRAPSAPRNLQASLTGIGEVTLRWEPPSDEGTAALKRYGIYRRSDGSEVLVAVIDASGLTYTDRNLPSGNYVYLVRARNYDGISDFSNEASVLVPNSP